MLKYFLMSLIMLLLSMLFFFISLIFMFLKFSIMINWMILEFYSSKIFMLFYLDWISMLFIFTVLIISSMIMFYSIEYMNSDKNNLMFLFLMLLFVISMIFMIISPNLISILLGWDGLGLISYCLVIFYQSKYSYKSGNLTILMNRIGDITLILSISIMFNLGSWLFMNFDYFNQNLLNLLLMLIIITAFTKSAQFPFSAWLPVAMAAPTPVSSLVHSSTLVTAGIYLLIRFYKLLYKFDKLLMIILFTSLLTTLMASMSALLEYDMKKIIAYSTLSQLGLMMMIYSMKFMELSFLHLVVHAMFKSMMFMCSGIFIHSMLNYQDIRFYGMMNKFMPFTCIMFFISNLSLCGLPFLSGFFSKDLLLEMMLMNELNYFIYLLIYITTMMTMMYSFRLILYLMNNKFRFLKYYSINDSMMMNISMLILMLFSLMFGMMLNWIIFMNIELIYLYMEKKMLIIIVMILGFYFSKKISYSKLSNSMFYLMQFFGSMWFMYKMINLLILLLKIGKLNYKFIDKGWSEFLFKKSLNIMFNNKIFMINLNMFYKMMLLMMYLMMMIYLFY